MIMTRLRQETKEYHSRLETLPYFRTLMEHRLPLECYVNQLRSLAVIHSVMETEIPASEDRRLISVWDDGLKKLPLLEQDLMFFEPRVVPDSTPSLMTALAMTEKIRLRRIENPVTLLGYLYVFEGSTLGNRIHSPDISATFHLNETDGCCYYSSYRDQVKNNWKKFTEKMNRTLDDLSLHEPVIQSAHEAFSGLEKLYNSLYPLSINEKTFHVTRINPEAGNHPIPDDEREIRAALRASERSWSEFPNYELRYGQRGKRFSDSDTCWLVTLTNFDPDIMQKQIDWIGRVLASRGMPRLLLEHCLRILYEELIKAVPDKAPLYEKLIRSADILAENRENIIPDAEFRSLSDEFDRAVGSEMALRCKNTGKLLLSSVADEKSGIKGAVSALQDWMTDSERHSKQWIAAVNNLVKKAGHA